MRYTIELTKEEISVLKSVLKDITKDGQELYRQCLLAGDPFGADTVEYKLGIIQSVIGKLQNIIIVADKITV